MTESKCTCALCEDAEGLREAAKEIVELHAAMEAARTKNRKLIRYVSHIGCARNGLGGGMADCTCGLDDVLGGP